MTGSETDRPDPSPELRGAHEALISAVDGDERHWRVALDRLATALDDYWDPDDALDALDALVGVELDTGVEQALTDLAAGDTDSRSARHVRIYAAMVEDLYESLDLPFAAWEMRFRRGRLALDLELVDEAVELLQTAAPALATSPEVYAGSPWHLLGVALVRQDRTPEAIDAFELAASVSAEQSEHAMAAESLDEVARLVEERSPERSVRYYADAAEQWRLAGDAEEAGSSLALAGWAALDVVSTAYSEGDRVRRETFAKLAYDAGLDNDENLSAIAAVQLALVYVERFDPAPAIELLTVARATFERNGEGEMLAPCLAVLAAAHGLTADITTADALLRQALAMAEHLDDQALVAHLLGFLGNSAEMRFDNALATDLLTVAAQHMSEVDLPLMHDQHQLMALMMEGNLVDARSLAESIVRRTIATPRVRLEGLPALGVLVIMLAAEGDAPAVERHVQRLEDLSGSERVSGEAFSAAGIDWILPVMRAFAALARGEVHASQRILLNRHDELLSDGAGLMAARLAGLVGLIDLQTGQVSSAVDRLVPVMLALSRQLAILPSSAEREALRTQLQHTINPAFQAIAATGNDRLFSEILEIVRSQSIPEPTEGSDAIRSVASLLGDLLPGRFGSRFGSLEQETNLAVPPLIVMPWGTVALDRLNARADRYLEASHRGAIESIAVPLVIPR